MSFLKQDRFLTGLALGFIIPFVGYAILISIYDWLEQSGFASTVGFADSFRERTLGLIAICLNLTAFHFFKKHKLDNSMRGVVIPTMVYVIFWIYRFSSYFF